MKWTLKDKKSFLDEREGRELQRQKGGKGNSKGGGGGMSTSPTGQESRLATGEEGTGKEAHPSEDLRTFEP